MQCHQSEDQTCIYITTQAAGKERNMWQLRWIGTLSLAGIPSMTAAEKYHGKQLHKNTITGVCTLKKAISGLRMEMLLLAASWNYHHLQLHGNTTTRSCMEIPLLANAWNNHR